MKAKTHRLLLVDDDADERFFTSRTLKKVLAPGATVNVVHSGDDAIAYMIGEGEFSDRKKFPFPTIIVTDLNMEGGDGFDVLQFIQNNPAWSVVPRIVYSSSDDDDDVRTAFHLGVSAYHQKASDVDATEELLREIVEYWSKSLVPPVDENGRLLKTRSAGRRGSRFSQPVGGNAMKRPDRSR